MLRNKDCVGFWAAGREMQNHKLMLSWIQYKYSEIKSLFQLDIFEWSDMFVIFWVIDHNIHIAIFQNLHIPQFGKGMLNCTLNNDMDVSSNELCFTVGDKRF